MAKYQPRPYQERALRAIAKTRSEGSTTALAVMASGLGKTVVAGFDVRRFLRQKSGARVLYLCHQNDILKQARKTFEENILPQRHTHGYLTGQGDDIHEVTVLYASFQTMHRHRTLFRPAEFDYIVVDESHHGPARTYLPTLKYFRPKFLLAITATPDRTDQQNIEEIYGAPVFELALEQAWAEGLLTPVDYRVVTDEWQNLKVLDTPVGRLSITQLNKAIFAPRRDEEIVRIIEDKLFALPHPRVVIFSPRISHCEQLAVMLPGAVAIHSRMSEREQAERLEAFRNGETRAVITVDKFNEGIDVPEANVIVFLRSTASRTVFFQQLGRGLRLSKGKKQVLVLDFVANCDRLVMLEDLRQGVQERLAVSSRFILPDNPLHVDSGEFDFDEVARDVLDVVTAIKTGYTPEILIEQLKRLAIELGRTPLQRDVAQGSKAGKCASTVVFGRYFGSFTAALMAAGMRPNVMPFSDDELLDQLRQLAEKLGRSPTVKDMAEASKRSETVSVNVYARIFGSLNRALLRAGLPLGTRRGYTRDELISEMKLFAEKLGHPPASEDYKKHARRLGFASIGTIRVQFGSLNAARKMAGFEPVMTRGTTRAVLIEHLRQLHEELGRPPTWADIEKFSKEGRTPSTTVYRSRFGGISEIYDALGIKPIKYVFSDDELLEYLRELAVRLGRPITQSDISKACVRGVTPGVGSYKGRFGSLAQAVELAGVSHLTRRNVPKDELIARLKAFAEELGHTPTMAELNEASKEGRISGQGAYQGAFGSYVAALNEAGLTPRHREYSDNELLEILKQLRSDLGREPNSRDIKDASRRGQSPTRGVFEHRFGSLIEALQAAGMAQGRTKRKSRSRK